MGDLRKEYGGIERTAYDGIKLFLEEGGAVPITSHSIEVHEGRIKIYHYDGCTIRVDYIGRLKTLKLRSVGESSKTVFDSIENRLDEIIMQQRETS